MKRFNRNAAICGLLSILLLSCNGISRGEERLSPALLKILPSDASLILKESIDSLSCNMGEDGGGTIIEADFNQDGKIDSAILIAGNINKKAPVFRERNYFDKKTRTVVQERKKYYEIEIWFVALLDSASDSPHIFILDRWVAFMPDIGCYIRLVKPGRFEDRISGKISTISNPSISLKFCEKSETLYYWDDRAFEKVVLAD